ncbi:exodeoxyribonuclease V subunit alpha [Alteromonas sp. ASW11-36]|uniref:RecBCD enzyme subunit RecD n=1 Tax=Alteromonas arenosi TaxID=3055817 RepID=A0ABT7SWB2_9ALTE|nr:exodeoxyribonuclease V subunit alpha [Alteromonas sp. ASW11-36]MDM7860482.1 exodeoxyribonuclease V subunit alpha [Alteromonas sp. ASW11-36]
MIIKSPTFNAVCQQCHDVIALDYFFAKALLEQAGHNMTEEQLDQAFELLLALSWAQRQGHSCLALAEVSNVRLWRDAASDKLGIKFADQETLLGIARNLVTALPNPKALVLDNLLLYTARAYHFEQNLQQQLRLRLKHKPVSEEAITLLSQGSSPIWGKLFPHTNTQDQINWQGVAAGLALTQPLLILSGGPGTGKTYTIARMLIALLVAANRPLKIGLAAPTGKAAQRLNESLRQSLQAFEDDPHIAPYLSSVPDSASTIHRMLGLREGTVNALYNEQNPLSLDVLIIDESSMLDLALFARIVRAAKPDCRLVFVGDAHQLPAVEAGNVLPMLMSRTVNRLSNQQQHYLAQLGFEFSLPPTKHAGYCIELQHTHRFNSQLGEFANALKCGVNSKADAERAWQSFIQLCADPNVPFTWVEYELINQQLEHWVRDHFLPIAKQSNVSDALLFASRFRILTALKKGEFGSENLNNLIEQKLKRLLGISTQQQFYHGRLVIVTRNAPALNLFNGDVGVVWQEGSQLNIYFESSKLGEYRVISSQRFSDIDSVFAMTIHKSQGSEFDHVAVVLPDTGGESLLSNELIYTAVTRTKRALSIVTNAERFRTSISYQTSRWSGIKPLDSDFIG